MARYRFAGFEADTKSLELRRNGSRVPVQPQPFRILSCLLEASGGLVTREDLIQALWGDTYLADSGHSLNIAVRKLRAALDDSSDEPRLVETVARQGYRFIGAVEREVDTIPAVETARPFWHRPALATLALTLFSLGAWIWLPLGFWTPLRARTPPVASTRTSGDRVILETSQMYGPRGSRDGRYFAYLCEAPSPRISICVLDTATGTARIVLKAPASEHARYWRPLASPDGQSIAYTWFANEKKEQKGDLHVFHIGESAGRPLVTGSTETNDFFSAVDWTADGKGILVAKTNRHASGLHLVPINGSPAAALVSPDFDWASGRDTCRFSMDGKWIAYPAIKGGSLRGGYRPTDVFVMPASGGSPVPVATGGGSERVVGWLANGDLIVTSDRGGKTRPYRVRLSNGQPQGEIELVDEDVSEPWIVGVNPADSSLYIYNQHRETDLHVFKSTNDKLRRYSNSYQGHRPAFSPDQSKLAYVAGSDGNNFLVVREMRSGEERRLPAAIPNVQSLAWYPDNRHVLAICNTGNWTSKPTFRFDTVTGAMKTTPNIIGQNAWWTPTILNDGRSLIITTRDPKAEMGNSGIIQSLDLDSGTQRVLFRPRKNAELLGSYSISRDRSTIVYAEHKIHAKSCTLLISSIVHPKPRVLVEEKGDACLAFSPHFTPDAKTIVYWRIPSQLWMIPSSGGEPKLLRELEWSPDGPAFHGPTGEIIVGSGGKRRAVFRQKLIQPRLAARYQ
ncbi:MAG: winged helix-turn-helix domain-containing protein [Acidobacteria bacterium]|nr:winged helix-turn-helix domain-containing protein [Acidobacteriota bacterium]